MHEGTIMAGTDALSNELAASIVVPTRNRSVLLRELLNSLLAQDIDPSTYEIIVVDNCSKDDTAQMIEALQAEHPGRIVYHPLVQDRGPVHARNVGATVARGRVIALTDSDCRAQSDWLRNGLKPFEGPVAFVSGAVLDKPEQKLRLFSGSYSPVTSEHPTYPACNIFYRRDVFLGMNGFDESLYFRNFIDGKPVECADTDLAWRIRDAGHANAFARNAVVYHEVANRKPLNWIVDPFRIFAVPALVKRHPGLRPLLLMGGLFFRLENLLFDVAVIAALLGIFAGRYFLLACLPYPLYVFYLMARDNFSVLRIPKVIAQVMLLSLRQFFVSAGLLYGSLRFGSLVL